MGPDYLLAAIRRRYEAAGTEELVRVAGDPTNAYTNQAKAVALEILVARGVVTPGDEGRAAVQAMLPDAPPDPEAARPLGAVGKITCLLACGVPALIIAGYLHQKGRRRARGDAFRFLAYGWLLRFAVVAPLISAERSCRRPSDGHLGGSMKVPARAFPYLDLFPAEAGARQSPMDDGGAGRHFVYLTNRNHCK